MSPRPATLAGVEASIAGVSAVRHVLHAIRALARAQLAPVERLAAESTAWLDGVQQILDRLTAVAGRGDPADRRGAAELVVVIGPERAFCGGLPRQVHEAVPAGPVALVGQRLIDLADEGMRARARFLLPGPASPDEVPDVARQIAEAVLASAPGRVLLVHPARGAGALHEALLLPEPRRLRAWLPDTFSAPEVVVEAAVRELATGRLAVALADTLRAEVRARLAAADAAVHAADARLRDLAQAARVQRQEQITNEILEIVASRLATD